MKGINLRKILLTVVILVVIIFNPLTIKAEEKEVNSETSKVNHKVIINSIVRNFEKSKRPYNRTVL